MDAHRQSDDQAPSQLRRDIISGDWVVIATGRAKRPDEFRRKEVKETLREAVGPAKQKTKSDCVFCRIVEKEEPLLVYSHGEKQDEPVADWTTVVVANKFPAFAPGKELNRRKVGPYQVMEGVGFHELVVLRDHNRRIGQLEVGEIKELFDVYQERYLDLSNEPEVNYVSLFHNEGEEAGASITHPHSQIIAIPTTDPDIESSLVGSKRYWQANNKCPHCVMIDYDRRTRERVVWENEEFVVCCPFVPRTAFETRVYPKKHQAYFERIKDQTKLQLAEAFQKALIALRRGLNKPDYNFFLHTAPCDGKSYNHYHWHWQIIPKTQIWAGFELGTEIEISTITPERAADYLAKQLKD